MVERNSKRRRTEAPTTQSKLYHFFSKPPDKPRKPARIIKTQCINTCDNYLKENQKPGTCHTGNEETGRFESSRIIYTPTVDNYKPLADVTSEPGNIDTIFKPPSLNSANNPPHTSSANEKTGWSGLDKQNERVTSRAILTLEELNTCDVDSLEYSPLVKVSTTQSRQPTHPPSDGSSVLVEMNTADINTLPCSIIIERSSSKQSDHIDSASVDESNEGTPPKSNHSLSQPTANQSQKQCKQSQEQCKQSQEQCKQSQKQCKQSQEQCKQSQEQCKQSQEPSYMDKVWAMFHSDSEEENEAGKGKLSPKIAPDIRSATENGDNVAVFEDAKSLQVEEMNTVDMLTVPYSPVIGKGTGRNKEGLPVESDYLTVDNITQRECGSDENSTSLPEFSGMRAPDSIFNSLT